MLLLLTAGMVAALGFGPIGRWMEDRHRVSGLAALAVRPDTPIAEDAGYAERASELLARE